MERKVSPKHFAWVLAAVLLSAQATTYAAVTVNPNTGWAGEFGWNDGLGQIDSISGAPQVEWEITLAGPGTLDVWVYDEFTAPTSVPDAAEFELRVNGNVTAWTHVTNNGSNWTGQYDDLALTGDTHSITLFVTDLANVGGRTWTSGTADIVISPVTRTGDSPPPVPAPGTMALVGIGTGLAGWIRRWPKV